MTTAFDGKPAIVRTERGLTISGTRITVYDVMDHLKAGWAPKLIRHWLPLTEEELDVALSYIEANRAEVEADYQALSQATQEMREYWDNKNRDRLAQIAKLPPKPGQEEMYAKLQAWKAKLRLTP
ncbi:MAG: DUF433 domain-containing protein [Chroococcidiopsidaceae cyanobacterium CP_BM_RX_35]|nr:DUF433 domain-containing protein [Chroococcidiopsidaceae cyanobacterium CP_BM_RX_35]